MARRSRTWRGRRPLAGTETLCAEPGRPCIWPDEPSPGPHGEPTGYDRDGRMQGVGQPHSIDEALEQRFWCARVGGGGGEKGAEIGRASCREREWVWEGWGSLKEECTKAQW